MAIGPILFVCRQWNSVACHTPSLWATIHSDLKPNPGHIKRLTSYVRKAIEYSRSLPLDVTIQLRPIDDLWLEMANILYAVPSWSGGEDDSSGVLYRKRYQYLDWLDSPCGYYNFEYDLYQKCPPFEEVSDAINDHVQALLGTDNVNLERVYSLNIRLESLGRNNWFNEDGLPVLHRLEAIPVRLSLVDETMGHGFYTNGIYEHPSPRLKSLSWEAECSLDKILIAKDQLIDLRIFWSSYDQDDDPLPCTLPSPTLTQNLRRLYIKLHRHLSTRINKGNKTFSFPLLEDLALHGTEYTAVKFINAPHLKCLRLINEDLIEKVTLECVSHFSFVEKLHLTIHDLTAEDIKGVFPAIKELGILKQEVDIVAESLRRIGPSDFMIKAFKYSDENFWTFDLPYEDNEIPIEP
jgi:hypothetical protein